MTRSLRSRLIVGMLLGMAVLLLASSTTIYTVQREQLYRAFDETLLNSANAIVLLVRPAPFGSWFDSEALARLPAGQIRAGALFQLWSDLPIDASPQRPGPDGMPNEPGPGGPPWDDRPPPEPGFPGQEPSRGPPPPRPPPREPGQPPGSQPGELVFRSPSLNNVDLPRLEARPDQPRVEDITLPGGAPGRAVGLQFQAPDRGRGPRRSPRAPLTAVVAASTADIEKQLNFLAALLGATALGTMAVAGAVAWLVVSRGLRPLAAVARKIATLDETGLKQRLADCGVPREIEPVVSQLNGLLGRLDGAFDRERALTADIAHELRTPVAEIRTITEVTLSRPRDSEEYRQALGETRDAIGNLQGLIEKLLILARLEAGQVKPGLELVALKPILARHWAQDCDCEVARGVTFENRCRADALVVADVKLLDVVLSNALSNAARYTPDGGGVTVVTQQVGVCCQLDITNTGCELSKAEIDRVFDRFWRADTARSQSGLNCGLGLTLVRRAMEAMGGKAEADVNDDRRFILSLTFTAADRQTQADFRVQD